MTTHAQDQALTIEKRPRRMGRRTLILAALVLAGSTAFVSWWTTTLVGLPDVGDPFDVATFSPPIPDETNAFVLYKEATALLPKEEPDSPPNFDWKTATAAQRAWLDRSREALAVWRKGTDRPDARYVDPATATFETKLDVVQTLRSFARLATLEGSRLEDSGDFEGALDWYLALLRSSRHCGKRGVLIERLIGIAMHGWVCPRLTRWSADPKVDARLLRRALDAALAADAAIPPISDCLKLEYLSLMHSLANAELMARIHEMWVESDSKSGSNTLFGRRGWKAGLLGVHRRAINDPERSRRVARMVFANWLAYCDLPPSQRPPKVISATTSSTLTGPSWAILSDLFVVGDEAPWQARALPPEKLARWHASTIDAALALPAYWGVDKALARERSAQDALLFNLANELYKREHGQYPEHAEELVGPYLKTLPPGHETPK